MWAHVRAFYGGSDVALGHAYSHITAVIAAAQIVGGPLAALLLRLDGFWGLSGWQILFLVSRFSVSSFLSSSSLSLSLSVSAVSKRVLPFRDLSYFLQKKKKLTSLFALPPSSVSPLLFQPRGKKKTY